MDPIIQPCYRVSIIGNTWEETRKKTNEWLTKYSNAGITDVFYNAIDIYGNHVPATSEDVSSYRTVIYFTRVVPNLEKTP